MPTHSDEYHSPDPEADGGWETAGRLHCAETELNVPDAGGACTAPAQLLLYWTSRNLSFSRPMTVQDCIFGLVLAESLASRCLWRWAMNSALTAPGSSATVFAKIT